MQLNVNDTITAKAGATDINRAFADRPMPRGWFITLDGGKVGSLNAMLQPNGSFMLVLTDATGRREAMADTDTAKAVLQKFLAGDARWRKACVWRNTGAQKSGAKKSGTLLKFVPNKKPPISHASSQPPQWAKVTMTVVIGAVVLIVLLAQVNLGLLRAIVPFSDSSLFWVGLIAVPFVTLIAVAIISKLAEFRQAATWTQTTGRILRSTIGTKRHRFGNEPETVVNVPVIEYEFKIGGRTVLGHRVAIGEDPTGVNTEAAVTRYPKGMDVTVFYDPADPANCVLERDPPLAIATSNVLYAVVAAVVALIYVLLTRGPAYVAAHFSKVGPHPELP